MTTRIVLLCEDDDHDRFVRRFLSHRNFGNRDIFTLPLPDGAQSGEQWVRDSYPLELKKVRRRTNVFLVVVVDADTHTVAGRKSQLDRECDQQDVPRGTPKDPVVVVVPRRAIETWLAWLLGEPVDEETKYRAGVGRSVGRRPTRCTACVTRSSDLRMARLRRWSKRVGSTAS